MIASRELDACLHHAPSASGLRRRSGRPASLRTAPSGLQEPGEELDQQRLGDCGR